MITSKMSVDDEQPDALCLEQSSPRSNRLSFVAECWISPLILIGSCTPMVTSWIVIGMSYINHWEHIQNFTACSDDLSFIPAASWPIGVYTPERFIWMIGIVIHLPLSIWHGFIFHNFFRTTNSPNRHRFGYRYYLTAIIVYNILEMYGLAVTSIIDVEVWFWPHVLAAGVWMFNICAYMFANVYLYHHSGWRFHSRQTRIFFWVKMGMMVFTSVLSISSGLTYPYYTKYCDVNAYTFFSFAEYTIGHMQGVFHALHYFELKHMRFGLYVIRTNQSDRGTVCVDESLKSNETADHQSDINNESDVVINDNEQQVRNRHVQLCDNCNNTTSYSSMAALMLNNNNINSSDIVVRQNGHANGVATVLI